ncbi:MAG TPA: hypothetical protein PLJ27_09960, partial [Polyangiaceae bacterium]|nr:hypothetical protein [Polyangiaceae bacterium]
MMQKASWIAAMVCFAMPMGVGSCGADDAGKLFEADRVPASGAYGGQGGSGGVGGGGYTGGAGGANGGT